MKEPEVRFTILPDTGDCRGASFQTGTAWLKFLSAIDDAHIAVILPGCVRGNHFHAQRREVIAVLHSHEWQAAWDHGPATSVNLRDFAGAGAVLLEVEPGAAHAIANTGPAPLWIVGLSHGAWDPDAPDSFPRVLLPRKPE
jgi:dTDP-4-dehydrorhamnose 3,5-epimerase-like enzyme